MAKMIHAMIRVIDLDASLTFYKQALDLDIAERLDFDGFSLVYLRNQENDMELELTWNKGTTEPYSHGTGYGHIAVAVDDLDAEYQKLVKLNYNPAEIKEFFREGTLLAKFFFVQDPDGYKIEFLQRHGRYQ
ncbi:VOC family protein [Photobacterium phosphoreum]|mgnify:CR=1 FL=1|jgi:lactoylglutathione lyase|uniref:VOC family protein n=1 Tax=Photobacterium phosphoreum TaxID=659 RepID=UPI0005D440DC|nr:VOC family protein [Photobacterium phosphoreum]KJF88276.1 lactoylglutathione lyase [Photobacterium phosphoreum]MCD9470505.1 lactoylglutathione lyase [Photobacterium phosphoreum]MCD9474284.1 lactoylglutathione lyase [Photobacterium phosphoreum]MCD9479297.1 lactoylglutathione lyase [Photobacterium phosphoreum]MCD9484512.1 lactoylglutathione lyase [Photobacterium phosphoreum]